MSKEASVTPSTAHSDYVKGRLEEGTAWESSLGFPRHTLSVPSLSCWKANWSPSFEGEAAPHMILETVLCAFLWASGLDFWPSWDTEAWIQLSGTELVDAIWKAEWKVLWRSEKVKAPVCSWRLGVHPVAEPAVTMSMWLLCTRPSDEERGVWCARTVTVAPSGQAPAVGITFSDDDVMMSWFYRSTYGYKTFLMETEIHLSIDHVFFPINKLCQFS